jgi:hypothetical protein
MFSSDLLGELAVYRDDDFILNSILASCKVRITVPQNWGHLDNESARWKRVEMTSGCKWLTTHPPCHGHSGAFFPVSPVTFARASSSSPAFPDAQRGSLRPRRVKHRSSGAQRKQPKATWITAEMSFEWDFSAVIPTLAVCPV